MTEEDGNVTTLKNAYRLWHDSKAGSVAHWLSLMTDDVRFQSTSGGIGGAGFRHECRSRAEVEQYFQEIGAEWEMVRFGPEEFVAQGARVAVLGTCEWRSRGTGTVVVSPFAQFFTFTNGRIARVVEIFDSAAAMAARGAQPTS
jgi:ketosteroid isomerase-like protein